MKILILEDDENRIATFMEKLPTWQDVTCVTTAEAAIEKLSTEEFAVVFLDHDLGGEVYVDPSNPNTGSGVVRWMLQNVETVQDPDIVIHSMNTPAALAMEQDLKGKYGFVWRIPFPTLVTNYLNDPSFLR
ncbi:MAG: response regulator [Hydrogenophaga sp.]|uniref:response regulator n=1 Tax=Hydrogenophaga sp. TaxID=1904254 RepID=UPI00260693A6|nr:response regulator [Hydrogenophaga sp.]MCV0439867.1 response regulator [Hydrogenophaga sp.]